MNLHAQGATMLQTYTAAHGATVIPTGFHLARVSGEKPKFKSDPDLREVVFYQCYLSQCHGENGLEPCEYLAERNRYLLSTARYMVNTGLSSNPVIRELVRSETEVKYLSV
ncbi:hypothetical protein DZC31_31370 (plasmid) [Stenotrophomonas rhizophila]|nr:hypothetical protein DZC31_31370 [Stenotrophomonas rhizophila]